MLELTPFGCRIELGPPCVPSRTESNVCLTELVRAWNAGKRKNIHLTLCMRCVWDARMCFAAACWCLFSRKTNGIPMS